MNIKVDCYNKTITIDGYVFRVKEWMNGGVVNMVTAPDGRRYMFTGTRSNYSSDQTPVVTFCNPQNKINGPRIIEAIESGSAIECAPDMFDGRINYMNVGREAPLHCHSVVDINGRIIPAARL